MIYPWQRTIWQQLTTAFTDKKLPHALLFSGMKGIGKVTFVQAFAQYLFCEKRNQGSEFCADATTSCQACHLIQTNAHPSVYYVTPEKAGHAIKIDQIREMLQQATQSAYLGHYQCIIIHPAHQLNHFAANALLKTLEEPCPNVFLFLISDERSRLLATINSRCMHVAMPVPTQDEAHLWLSEAQPKRAPAELSLALTLAAGAPLQALILLQKDQAKTRQLIYQTLQQLVAEPGQLLQSAALLQEVEMQELFSYLLSWLMDAAKIKCGVALSHIDNQDYADSLQIFAQRAPLSVLDNALHVVFTIRNQFLSGINLNKTLSIETMLMTMERCQHVSS